ncbi:protein NO VEIN domain-containing protein [Nocardioides sp. LML1-1-1.1]|uniref:protein NO VEIN domain-containing protein n=1 Tax=Nocardioides sp. LML1-1-1.1 TaxID=3135248 RepID=UPI00342894BA
MIAVTSQDSNARLVELIRAGLARADAAGLARVPLKLYPSEEREELLTLLHAYLWDTAAPYDDDWHRSPGNIMTLWAELLEIDTETRHRLIPLRTDLVKLLTERGLGYRTHPRSVPVLVREFSGPIETPVHPGDPRETSSTIAVGAWGAGFGDPATNREVELAAEAVVQRHYETAGWTITRVAHLKCGWDLTATHDDQELHIEVKGVSSSMPSVLLTRNELRSAESDSTWLLAVVTNALTDCPTLTTFHRETVVAAADPAVYRVNLAP